MEERNHWGREKWARNEAFWVPATGDPNMVIGKDLESWSQQQLMKTIIFGLIMHSGRHIFEELFDKFYIV